MGFHFLAKIGKVIVLYLLFEPPGILRRIQLIDWIWLKWDLAGRINPRSPTPGVGMTVVYTSSLKLGDLRRLAGGFCNLLAGFCSMFGDLRSLSGDS